MRPVAEIVFAVCVAMMLGCYEPPRWPARDPADRAAGQGSHAPRSGGGEVGATRQQQSQDARSPAPRERAPESDGESND